MDSNPIFLDSSVSSAITSIASNLQFLKLNPIEQWIFSCVSTLRYGKFVIYQFLLFLQKIGKSIL